jgi:hypothetical protein
MTEIKFTTYQGVRDAVKVTDREFREIEGTGVAVTRGGKVFVDEDIPEVDDFPYLTIMRDTGIYRAHVPTAVALAWTTPEERAQIRAEVSPGATVKDSSVVQMVPRVNIWAYAVACVANTPEEDLAVIDARPLSVWEGKTILRKENVSVSDYAAFLFEPGRPPSKGGNTTALHTHAFFVDGARYSFFARGSRMFVYKGDTVSFDYHVTDDGYHNVLPRSIVTRDAKGKTVIRGDRRHKAKLRTAPTKMPGSRRERRD